MVNPNQQTAMMWSVPTGTGAQPDRNPQRVGLSNSFLRAVIASCYRSTSTCISAAAGDLNSHDSEALAVSEFRPLLNCSGTLSIRHLGQSDVDTIGSGRDPWTILARLKWSATMAINKLSMLSMLVEPFPTLAEPSTQPREAIFASDVGD